MYERVHYLEIHQMIEFCTAFCSRTSTCRYREQVFEGGMRWVVYSRQQFGFFCGDECGMCAHYRVRRSTIRRSSGEQQRAAAGLCRRPAPGISASLISRDGLGITILGHVIVIELMYVIQLPLGKFYYKRLGTGISVIFSSSLGYQR